MLFIACSSPVLSLLPLAVLLLISLSPYHSFFYCPSPRQQLKSLCASFWRSDEPVAFNLNYYFTVKIFLKVRSLNPTVVLFYISFTYCREGELSSLLFFSSSAKSSMAVCISMQFYVFLHNFPHSMIECLSAYFSDYPSVHPSTFLYPSIHWCISLPLRLPLSACNSLSPSLHIPPKNTPLNC